jgi:Domain of unknown function DUF29
LAYSPADSPRFGWMSSIIDARAELEDKLSPTLRRDIEENLTRLYGHARKQAEVELQAYGEHQVAGFLPAECPYSLDQVLADDWYPEPPGEPK